MYEWRQEMIEEVKHNGHDSNGNSRYALTLGSGGFTKRVTIAGRYGPTNGLRDGDAGPAWVYMNWDTGRAKYVMFKNPCDWFTFRVHTMNHVRKVMEDRNAPMLANALGVLKSALVMMKDSFYQHESVDSAFKELRTLLTNIPAAEELYIANDEGMTKGLEMMDDYLTDMDLWWHDRMNEYQVRDMTTFSPDKLDYRTQGFDWVK